MWLHDDQVKHIVESAFAPLRCGAKVWDYGNKLRFQVLAPNDEPVITVDSIPRDIFQYEQRLVELLDDVRRRVEEKSFKLEARP